MITRTTLAVLALVCGLACASSAVAQPFSIQVSLHQSSGAPLSYFDLSARPGHPSSAGTLELRNRSGRSTTVLIDPLSALTLNTLGVAYQPRGARLRGSAMWMRLRRRRVVLAPGATVTLLVTTFPPAGTPPGDYLSGIGVQQSGQRVPLRPRSNLAVTAIDRYAIGLEVRVPGPREAVIRLTGAAVHWGPSGLTFYLFARNAGNVILPGVHGSATITEGPDVVARVPLGPGTFATGTSIAYPIGTPGLHPAQGARFGVHACLSYSGGAACIDRELVFGRADALSQQASGGSKPRASGSGSSLWMAGLVGVGVVALAAAGRSWRRRRSAAEPFPPSGASG